MSSRARPAPGAPTRFSNYADAELADELGRIDEETRALEAREKEAREEMTRRGRWAIEGEAFVVTKSVIPTMALDTAAVRAEMGEDWVRGYSKPGQRTTYRVGRKGQPAEPATKSKRAARRSPAASPP